MIALATPRLVVADAGALERRAQALAAPEAATADGFALRVILFRLGRAACAVDASAIERAVVALASPFQVPLADGGERTVAFVDERPVAVVDLSAAAAGVPAAATQGRPALVVRTEGGPIAALVDGPLELAEQPLAGATEGGGDGEAVRLAGRLAGGAALLDAAWLAAWAWKAAHA